MPDQLTAKFQRRVALIGARAGALTGQHWAESGHDEGDIPEFHAKTLPTLTAAKAAAVATGVAYYALRQGVRPPAINAKNINASIDPREPFISYWQGLKNGHPIEDAVLSGIARAEAIAGNLAVSAARLSGAAVLGRIGREPSHWVRTPDAGACEWCIEVSDLTFSTEDDADIGHDRCGCSIDPVFD